MERKMPVQEWRVDYWISGAIAVLMAIASLVGIIFQSRVYPTEELVKSFVTNDIINLVVGLPVILIPMWLARRGRLAGWILWMGALAYVTYNYMIYLFSMPINAVYAFFPLIVGLSVWGIARFLVKLDRDEITRRLDGNLPVRFNGGVLVFLGLAFGLRAIGVLVTSVGEGTLSATVLGLNLSDIILSVVWIIGGINLWQRTPLGFSFGNSLLFQGSMLFVALIAVLVVQPWVVGGTIPWMDVAILVVMGLIVFIPLWFFLRGAQKSG